VLVGIHSTLGGRAAVVDLQSFVLDDAVVATPLHVAITPDVLILKTLSIESMHGYGIAQHIQMLSADVLTIEEGSLYPALRRMLVKGWVLAEWKISANNRRARFYTLTTAGKKQLGVEESRSSQMFGAIMRVMKTT
jgi:PadR family transcriptional regulator, regulatory protein PadR